MNTLQAETVEKKEWMVDYTFYQAGANATLLAIAVWSLTSLGFHTMMPFGMDTLELTLLGTLTIIFWILVPLYWMRVWWSYIAGIGLIIGGLGGGTAIAAWSRVFRFSGSFYNFSIIIIYIISFAGIYFSYKAFTELR